MPPPLQRDRLEPVVVLPHSTQADFLKYFYRIRTLYLSSVQTLAQLVLASILRQFIGVTQPRALLLYRHILIGSQLRNQLEALGYEVETTRDAAYAKKRASTFRPLCMLIDLSLDPAEVTALIRHLKTNGETRYTAIIGYTVPNQVWDPAETAHLKRAGIDFISESRGLLTHLSSVLEQVLELD